jgi:hypothetical protein
MLTRILKEINAFIQQRCIKLKRKVTEKKVYISNKCCSFELFIYQRILKKQSYFHKNINMNNFIKKMTDNNQNIFFK